MAINVGDDITAIIYNGIRNDANDMYGTGSGNAGYGQSSLTVPPIRVISNKITGLDLAQLRNIIADLAIHTGSTLTIPTAAEFDILDTIDAVDWDQLRTAMNVLIGDRFLVAGGETSIESKLTTLVRTNAWGFSPQLINEFVDVTFTNDNEARWFFNLGGRIMIDTTTANGSGSNKDDDWIAMLGTSQMGELFMDHTTAGHITGSGGTTNVGFFDLSGSLSTLYTVIGASPYTQNDVNVFATLQTASRVIRCSVALDDGHDNIFAIQVTVDIGGVWRQRRSTNHYVAPNPTFSVHNDFDSTG